MGPHSATKHMFAADLTRRHSYLR